VTARGLRAVPIGLGREGRREPTVRITKLRGGLPRLPSVSELEARRSSTPGQLPDLAVGLGRRDDAGIGHTARPLPIAVADSPIEAASPDPQQPMCFLEECRPPYRHSVTVVAHGQLLAADNLPLQMPRPMYFRQLSSWHPHTITNPALPTRNPRARTEPNRNPAGSKKHLRSE